MLSIKDLDSRAKGLANNYLFTEKELLSVLIEMEKRKGFQDLGFTGIFNYCRHALTLSESQASYFSQIARKSKEVPALKSAIDEGKISVSQARRIVPVITAQTQQVWIERAQTLKQRDLERKVSEVNPRAVQERIKPVGFERHLLQLGMSESCRKKWDRALSLVSKKKGKVASLEETQEALLDCFLAKQDPIEKAKRAVLRKVTPTSKAPKRTCGRVPLQASLNHQVNLRDEGNCRVQGCANSKFTEIHHIKPVSQGGTNALENLITLCTSHHRLEHHRQI